MYALETLRLDAASAIHSLNPDEQRAGPYSPYEHGPTHQMFWSIDEHFMFLEVHNES
jgi:hypothetical protein